MSINLFFIFLIIFLILIIQDPTPKGHFDLKGMTVGTDTKPGDKKKFAFDLQKDGKVQFSGQVANQDLKNEWVNALKTAVTLEPCEAPSKDGMAKKKKQGVGMGMQKAVSSSVADSSVGKAVCRLFLISYFLFFNFIGSISSCKTNLSFLLRRS